MKTKVVIIESEGKVGVKEFDMPLPRQGEALVKIHTCNICTADWQMWSGPRAAKASFPMAKGHEMAGEIASFGPGTHRGLEIGDHVAIGHEGCGECYHCKSGHEARCANRVGTLTLDGQRGSFGMSQYLTTKISRLYRMNPDLPFEEASYLEPVATAFHGARRLRVTPGDDLLVIGAGNLGLVNAQVARAYGARVLVSEFRDARVELARELGFVAINPEREDLVSFCAEWAGEKGIDAVILAVASQAANDQAFKVLGLMGRILFFSAGYPPPRLNIDPNTIHYNEYELIGSMGASAPDFLLAARFLNAGTVKVGGLISHVVPLDEAQRAFELAATPGNYRVAIKMW